MELKDEWFRIFIKAGVKIDTDVYREEILKPVERWAEQHYGVNEDGKIFEINSDQSIHLQVIGTTGLFSKMELRRIRALMKIRTSSKFQRKSGWMRIFQISSERTSGRRHLPI
jgi:hypothetical protein